MIRSPLDKGWTDRPGTFWKQGLARPATSDTVPSHVHWDHWLGVAPQRPYVGGAYHPFAWRGWWDFGTGAAGETYYQASDLTPYFPQPMEMLGGEVHFHQHIGNEAKDGILYARCRAFP